MCLVSLVINPLWRVTVLKHFSPSPWFVSPNHQVLVLGAVWGKLAELAPRREGSFNRERVSCQKIVKLVVEVPQQCTLTTCSSDATWPCPLKPIISLSWDTLALKLIRRRRNARASAPIASLEGLSSSSLSARLADDSSILSFCLRGIVRGITSAN